MTRTDTNLQMEKDRSIDLWAERLAGLGVCLTWMFLAGSLYGLIRLVVNFF